MFDVGLLSFSLQVLPSNGIGFLHLELHLTEEKDDEEWGGGGGREKKRGHGK